MIPPTEHEHEQRAAWAKVRDAALYTLAGLEPQRAHHEPPMRAVTDEPGVYVVAVGEATLTTPATVHRVTSMAQLADVTRHERRRWAVVWPEDPGAHAMRRGD